MFCKTSKHLSKASFVKFCSNFLVILLVLTGLTGAVARAQLAGTGAISGTVQDPSGAIVPGATVTAINVDTNVKTVRTTTSAGDYNITPLTPGTYMVIVAAQGFEGYTQENVTVDALSTVAVNAKLTLGKASESVTVTSAPPLLSTTDASLGAVMDNEMYANLPLQMGGQSGNDDQRRATDFAALMPGVQTNYISTSNNPTTTSGSVNGGNPNGGVSEIYIDGLNLPEADGIGDPRYTWTAFGVDSIDQFQVQTIGYSAQYAGQGVQNYTVKSGGNAYHGSLYEYLRNTVLDAWPFTSKVPTLNSAGVSVPGGIKPKEIMNEFGIVLSGPIVKDKLFMFYNYGQYRDQRGPKTKAQTIPTAAMLGYTQAGVALGYADFTGWAAANAGYHIYDPATQAALVNGVGCSNCTRTQFFGMKNGLSTADVIPASRISAAANAINQFMLPYESITNQSAYTSNIDYGYSSGLANWYQTGRLDYNQSAKNQISLIVAFGRQASTGPNASGAQNQLGPPFNTSQSYTPKTTVDIVKDTYTINSHLVNQFAVAFARYKSLSVTPNDTPAYSASGLGLTNTPAGQATSGFPGISFSGNSSCPPTSGSGVDNPCNEGGYSWNQKVNNTYTGMDNLQWVFGKHNITVGGQVVDVQFNYIKNETNSGPLTYTFSPNQTASFTSGTTLSTTTGSSVASYLLGAVSSSSVTVGVPGLGSRWVNPSFWGQDDYKVNDKLTLNLGLRWDIFPSVHEAHNIFSFLNPNGVNSVTGNLGTLEFAGNGNSSLYCNCTTPSPIYWKNIAPRIGMAYTVDPKTVIHASYDVAFAKGNWTAGGGGQAGSPSTVGFTPSASANAGISGAPSFYWDNTACTNGSADGVSCGWTGSITAPAPPAGGTSLAEFATTETVALTNTGSSTITYFDPHYGSRSPEYINWSVGIQRQITKDMSLTVSYVGSEGHFISASSAMGSRNNKLPESMAALAGYTTATSTGSTYTPCSGNNCPFPLLTNKATASMLAQAQAAGFTPTNSYNSVTSTTSGYYASNAVNSYYVPFPQYSAVSDATSFVGNENYNALQISLRERMAHGLDFMFNYTYSRSIDDLGTFRVGDNQRLDRSLSAADEPQNLTATAVYALPFGRGHIGGGNFVTRSVVSDWKLSGIYQYHSGYPLAVTASGCGSAGILNQCMPNIVPGQAGRQNGAYGKAAGANTATTFTNAQYINPNAFQVNVAGTSANYGTTTNQQTSVGNGPALYVPGNAPRVAALNVWGMGTYNLDLGIKRVFPIYQNVKLQFEADILNATNHVVWASPSAAVGSGSSFGTLSAVANNPRDIQVSGRISW